MPCQSLLLCATDTSCLFGPLRCSTRWSRRPGTGPPSRSASPFRREATRRGPVSSPAGGAAHPRTSSLRVFSPLARASPCSRWPARCSIQARSCSCKPIICAARAFHLRQARHLHPRRRHLRRHLRLAPRRHRPSRRLRPRLLRRPFRHLLRRRRRPRRRRPPGLSTTGGS